VLKLSQGVEESFQKIVESIEHAALLTTTLQSSSAEVSGVMEGARKLVTGANNLNDIVETVQKSMKRFSGAVTDSHKALTSSTAQLGDSIKTSSQLLEEDVRKSSAAAALLTERLVQVAQTIIEQTRQQQGAKA
jgi:uncharacterized protein YoxC